MLGGGQFAGFSRLKEFLVRGFLYGSTATRSARFVPWHDSSAAYFRPSPALSDLAGGEDSPVTWVECEERVGRTHPLEIFVREVPVVWIIHEDASQRRLRPATLRTKGKVGCPTSHVITSYEYVTCSHYLLILVVSGRLFGRLKFISFHLLYFTLQEYHVLL